MTVKLIRLDVLVAGVVLKMLLVMGIQNGFEGCVAKKTIKSGRNDVAKKTIKSGTNDVAKKTIKSGRNGVCWVKVDNCGRFCFN